MNQLGKLACLLATLGMLALVPAPGHATDIAHAAVPSPIADNEVRIGSHVFKLPPGQWTLVQGQTFTTGSASNRDAEIFRGVVVLVDRKSTRLNSSHAIPSRMPSSA